MRQITFGPTHTNYFDIDQDDDREGGNQSDRVIHISDRRSRSVIASENRSHRVGSSGQNSPRVIPMSYVSRGSFHQNFSTSVLTGSQKSPEIIFFAGEDLYRENNIGTRELAIKKYCKCKLEFDDSRTYESYCHEFCGLLNLRFPEIQFMHGRKDIALMRTVKKPCEILVYYNKHSNLQRNLKSNSVFENSLGPAFLSLLQNGFFSDLEILVNGETINCHKCILIARSEKFRVMLSSDATQTMKEQTTNRIVVDNKSVSAAIYKAMLKWIYMGECELSTNPNEVIPLLGLTDEYLLPDFQKVCEDQIIDYMDSKTATDILTNPDIVLPGKSEEAIREAAKNVFLEDYERMIEEDPDLEERIFKIKGLMSELLTHKKKKKSIRKRRSSVGLANEDQSSKKKVRFNISSTIYEDTSAMHDESVSIIEPLSIFSNASPPGELADVSFPHSAISITSRGGLTGGNQQIQATTQERDTRNTNRPASAGEFGDGRHQRPVISRSLI